MKVAILQPSYIPWRGYSHQIQKADVQFDKHGWLQPQSNQEANGPAWLTVPVASKDIFGLHSLELSQAGRLKSPGHLLRIHN